VTLEQKITMAAGYKKMSKAKLARTIGMSPQKFNQRIKAGKFSDEEMTAIASALGAEFKAYFVFPDGLKIGD
jgi:DNA-binding transcriptional regulator YdaS (Cro superfamily)